MNPDGRWKKPRTGWRRRLLGATLVSAGIAAAGCGDLAITARAENYGVIVVEATDQTGSPVLWVRLELHDPGRPVGFGRTGADGRHVFPFVAAGVYMLAIQPPEGMQLAADQVPAVFDLRVERGSEQQIGVRLTSSFGWVRILAMDTASTPVAGVLVRVMGEARELASATTDTAGVALMSVIPTGTHRLMVEPPEGYRLEEEIPSVQIALADTTDVMLRLSPAEPVAPGSRSSPSHAPGDTR